MLSFWYCSVLPDHIHQILNYVIFGIRSQIVPLKLSFAFWVLPCKHFSNSVSLLSSKNIYRPYFINNVFWKTWPRFISLGVYKLALPALYLYELSETMGQPMGQCGFCRLPLFWIIATYTFIILQPINCGVLRRHLPPSPFSFFFRFLSQVLNRFW